MNEEDWDWTLVPSETLWPCEKIAEDKWPLVIELFPLLKDEKFDRLELSLHFRTPAEFSGSRVGTPKR